MSALLLWQIEPLCHFQKRFGGLDQGRGSEALEDQLGNQESDGLLSHDCHINIKSHQYQPSHPNHCQCLHHQLIAGSDDNDGEENREATAEVFYKSSWLAEASKQVNMILIKEGL